MGKKKNKGKQEKVVNQEKECEKGCCGGEAHSHEKESTQTEEQEVPLTAEERANQYIENANKIHSQFVNQFKIEEDKLNDELEMEDKDKMLAKREADEQKKLEKIIKKVSNDFDDIAGPGASNAKLVYDKLIRTLGDMRKVTRESSKIKKDVDDCKSRLTETLSEK